MKTENGRSRNDGLNRRNFVKGSAGAAITAGLLHSLSLPALAANSSPVAGLAKTYVCPPCGAPCDKLTFDRPGACPQCGMDLIPFGGGEGTPPKVAILLFNAAEIIDFAGPWEVFGTAGLLVHTVAEKAEPLTMVFGQKVIPDYTFENSPKAEVLLVPGGGVWTDETIRNPKLIQWIQNKSKDVMYVMSVCTGAFLLAKAGLLVNQTVTATYGMIEDLQTPQTKVVYDQRFVESGNIITTAGLSSGIDGALHLVSRMLGSGKAQSVALGMEYRWDPNSQYARASMADRFLPDGLAYSKPKLKGLEATMISTAGDTDRWETKVLVSEPHSSAEILDLIRSRIAANTARGGMFNPVPHIRGAVNVSPMSASDSRIKWKFTDDQGRDWAGLGTVEASPDDKGKFIVTLRLARDKAWRSPGF
jgi:putative intracellular protease/amidase